MRPHLAAVRAELAKSATLPGAVVAAVVAVLGSVGITVLNCLAVRNAVGSGRPELVADTSPVESVFSAAPIGTVGAVILGVVAISSEYTADSADVGGGRPITATLTAVPQRSTVLIAKALAVVLLVLAAAVVTLPACLAVAELILGGVSRSPWGAGELIGRCAGVAVYWALTALLALAITVLTRSGVVPLVVLIANSSLVSVSLLLMKLTPLARFLPDVAGIGMFTRDQVAVDGLLDGVTGGLVMAAWAMASLGVCAVVLARRDA